MRNEDKLSGAERFCHVAMTLVGLAVLLVMFVVLCYMVSDNMYVEIGLLAATLACILTGAWFANRKRRKESAAKSAAAMERLRESGVTKIREGEATGTMKPYEAKTMPLGLAKNVRTGDPAR